MRLKWSRVGMVSRVLFAVVLVSLVASACGAGSGGSVGVLQASAGVERAEADDSAPFMDLAAGFNDAGFDLWRSQPVEENLVFSPASVGHALLMVRAAADTATGSAIDSVFALPDGEDAHNAWNSVDRMIAADANAQEEITLTIADRTWPDVDLEPAQQWIDLLASHHGATVQPMDFSSDPASSRDVINSWVSDQTKGLIPELLPEGMIDQETLLMLTDAIYFEASWAVPFYEPFGVVNDFTLLDGSTIQTDFLHKIDNSDRTALGDGYAAAEIPYTGGAFVMVLIVPDEGEFEGLRDRLDQNLINEIDTNLTVRPYELLLPKWKTTTNLNLGGWMRQVNISPGSYPDIDPEAFIGGAVHAADITVDEKGTVAAAATAIDIEGAGPPEPEITIRADRAFYYLIRHQPTGMILFAGQVTNPAES
jgi:serpin B